MRDQVRKSLAFKTMILLPLHKTLGLFCQFCVLGQGKCLGERCVLKTEPEEKSRNKKKNKKQKNRTL